MRIVDADRLKKSFEANTPIAFQDCVPGIHSVIDLEPTVEAEPVRHGRWITDSFPMDDGDYLMERCTACGTAIEYGMGTPYCPFCGAKMEDEGEEE